VDGNASNSAKNESPNSAKNPIFNYSFTTIAMYQHQPEAVIYISPGNDNPCKDNPCNQLAAAEYQLIKDRFHKAEIPFVSLPDLLTDKHFASIIDYHHPYLGTDFLQKNLARTAKNPVLVYISAELNEVFPFELRTSPEGIAKEELSKQVDTILASILSRKAELSYQIEQQAIRIEGVDVPFSLYEIEGDNKADSNFEKDAFNLPKDLKLKIQEIEEAGYLRKLIEYLEEIEAQNRKFSRLKISGDHKIYLMDYGMKEVTMSPLPKALYLLFLNHPEGILFKELPGYRKELMNIYIQITQRENPDEARESIRRMTDPYDNSVNEKCSLIRSAFLKVISDDLAQKYYVTGNRGEPKRILLNRELVVQER
jgi:hypothetical protein